ncbi:BlaI/MecI/CopY family transcriptional regulator [Candidatus Woesebacteria bacterium]|nr:BlaI/MecI/CopY family transcriptional regulator [Candidatus Woesebacteria bacterium]MCD8506735.1 BlaI/MecI/CopY family transcriptional regulator [Candidatus Woesebacteria bacterium]MCD8527643.1 BlaI/MecI/CopY family transcriptional regulator [Candidatus Woesebacteria bacterium]MCD8546387.1 BlaI/MecI/CopY family transcriptional regulator [Candidatus Woesebacteria bacterium]
MNQVCQLGPLEKEIMDIIWSECPCNVRSVHEKLQNDREIAYTTVMTVMGRLVEKGILCRHKKGKAHVYDVCTSRRDMARFQARNFLAALFDRYEEDGIKALQDEIDRLPEDQQEILQTIFQK